MVLSLAALRPRSARTRPVSRIEVGSTTRARTRSRNTSSPRAPNPRSPKTPSSAWNSTRESVDTTRAGPAAAGTSPGGSASNSAGAAAGVTSRACGAAGSMPRSNDPWAGSASISRARSSRIPSSASVCADPTCATIFRRPPSYSAICTAVAPDAVRTRRIHATAPSLGHQLVPETGLR